MGVTGRHKRAGGEGRGTEAESMGVIGKRILVVGGRGMGWEDLSRTCGKRWGRREGNNKSKGCGWEGRSHTWEIGTKGRRKGRGHTPRQG